jgi:hypothetical protein
MYFPCLHLCSVHISMARMIAPRSTVSISFRTPPTILSLMEGGWYEIADKTHAHLDGSFLSVYIYDQYWIPDPPIHSSFNGGGGGGPECVINNVPRSAAKKQAHKSTTQVVFRTPMTDMLLTKGGVWNGIFPLGGGYLYVASIYRSQVPSPPTD